MPLIWLKFIPQKKAKELYALLIINISNTLVKETSKLQHANGLWKRVRNVYKEISLMFGFSHWNRNPGAFSTHYTTPSMIDLEKLERL